MQYFCELIMKEYTRTCFKNIRCTYLFGGAFDKEIMWKRIRKYNDKIRTHGTNCRMCNYTFAIKIYNNYECFESLRSFVYNNALI